MAYTKSPVSASKSPAAITKTPGTVASAPGDSVYTEAPSGDAGTPPTANAGADVAAHDQIATPAYTLAGSATGDAPITYLWEKVSGPGTVTFVDATDPETDVTFEWPGTYVLKLTATNDAGSDEDDVTIVVTAPLASLLTLMGAKTQYLYVVGASSETLNGSNFSQLNDLGPLALHASQGTAGNQPAKDATGGPLGDSCISPQGATRYLERAAAGITSGKQLWFMAASKCDGAATNVQCSARDGANNSVDNTVGLGAGTNFLSTSKCATGAETGATFTSPAFNTNWNAWTKEYVTGVTPASTIGGASATPGPATITGAANDIARVWLGHPTAAGGRLKLYGCFNAPSAAEKLAARQYMYSVTGLVS